MSAKWPISFDGRAFIARYPKLFKPVDDPLWEQWAREVQYNRDELWHLSANSEVDICYRARAVVIKNIPWEHQPFHWGKGKKRYNDREFDKDSSIDPLILQLTLDLRCSFMAGLPGSPDFDKSGEAILPRIWQINRLLLEYLNPPEGDQRSSWLDPLRQRAFDCYRLQGQVVDYSGGRKPFFALKNLLADRRDVDLKWKYQASRKIRPLIEKEAAGDDGCVGALAEYLGALEYKYHWSPEPDLGMGPEPFPLDLEVEMVEFLLGVDAPLGWRLPDRLLNYFEMSFREADRFDLVEVLGQQYLLETIPDEDSKNVLYLARQVVKYIKSPVLVKEAKKLVDAAKQRGGFTRKEAIERAAEREHNRRLREILKRMASADDQDS